RRLELGDDGRVVRRAEVLEHLRRAGDNLTLVAQHVLHRDGNAIERAERLAGGATFVSRGGLLQRAIGRDVQERADFAVDRLDVIEVRLGQFNRRDVAGVEEATLLGGGEAGEVGHRVWSLPDGRGSVGYETPSRGRQ